MSSSWEIWEVYRDDIAQKAAAISKRGLMRDMIKAGDLRIKDLFEGIGEQSIVSSPAPSGAIDGDSR